MKVVFASEAKADLLEIGDYIARDNPARARSFLSELKSAAKGLARFPKRYPPLPRHANSGLRCRVYGSYHIVYQVESRQVNIVRILHAARDYEALLFPDE
jgi:addiction module RelE/StbE family toxin